MTSESISASAPKWATLPYHRTWLLDQAGRLFDFFERHSIDPAGGMNGSNQGFLMRKLAVNGRGAVAIVNSSLKPNERSRVWLIRGSF